MSIYLAKWVTDPFAPKFFSLVQNNISHNIGDGLNFVTCEQTFKMIANDHHNPIELITQLQAKLKEMIQYEDLAGEEDTGGLDRRTGAETD